MFENAKKLIHDKITDDIQIELEVKEMFEDYEFPKVREIHNQNIYKIKEDLRKKYGINQSYSTFSDFDDVIE